jgi:hypothetical protein
LKFTVTDVVQDSGGARVVSFLAENGDRATLHTAHSPVDAFHLTVGQEVEFAVDHPKPPRVKKTKTKAKKGKK